MPKQIAYIGLGSNLGRREKLLAGALQALESTRGVTVQRVSRVYETQPVGGPPKQGPYLNCVARIETSLTPQRLLALLHRIETTLGRKREQEERWGPRTIDLDLLLYADRIVATEALMVPHPLMHERRFVMEPLAEIDPDIVHPTLQQTAGEILKAMG